MLIGVVFVAVSNVFGIMPAKLIRNAIDTTREFIGVYQQIKGYEAAGSLFSIITFNLLVFAGLVLVMALLKGFFMFLMRQTIIIVSRYIEYDLKNEIFNHYQQLDAQFYARNSTGDLMNRISEDVSRVRMYVGPAIMYTVNLIVMFVLVIYAMVQVDLKLTILTLLPLPLLSLLIYRVEEIINRKSELVQRQLSTVSTLAQESFSGIRVLKAFAREPYAGNHFAEQSEQYAKHALSLVKVNALFQPALLLLVGLSTVITVSVGGVEVINGRLTIGNIAEFIIYVNMLTWPVASLGWVVSLVQRAAASQERINEFLHTEPAIKGGSYKPENIKGAISFNNVSFRYPGADLNVIDGITFTVPPGTSLAITGRTGSGKSTIAGLMTRLFDPIKGQITIDGHDLRTYDSNCLHTHIGVVPQDSFLFSDTIENNIAFGNLNRNITDTELKNEAAHAARMAAVYDNIMELPLGMQTRVGERGITLSGGQKQRVSIARALMLKPDILILDDSLSAVDTQTEESIIRNIRREMQGKTTVWISHRVSSISHADHILVIENGTVAEAGSHEALLEKDGLYAELYRQQAVSDQV